MKHFAIAFLSAAALTACGDSGPSLVFERSDTLRYSDEPAGSVTVRGQSYDIIKSTGRDKETNEVFVVEYRTLVGGRRVSCVGDIALCPGAIERQLDNESDDDDSGGSY